MTTLSLTELRLKGERAIVDLPDGAPLDSLSGALIRLTTAVSVPSLSSSAIDRAVAAAFAAEASVDQIQEMIALASGLGVHSLIASATIVFEQAAALGLIDGDAPLDDGRQALWDQHVGDDPFWTEFSKAMPGFLDALLRLSPDIFTGFFEYCAIPWHSGTVSALIKELAAMACDANPAHRFGPGFHVHLANAIKLGAGRLAINEALDIAAATPSHKGYR